MELYRPDVDGVQNTHVPSYIMAWIFYEHTTFAHNFHFMQDERQENYLYGKY